MWYKEHLMLEEPLLIVKIRLTPATSMVFIQRKSTFRADPKINVAIG
jgi:hypothetical protein